MKGSLCVCLSMSLMYFQVSGELPPRHRQALPAALQEGLCGHPVQRMEPLPIHVSRRYTQLHKEGMHKPSGVWGT